MRTRHKSRGEQVQATFCRNLTSAPFCIFRLFYKISGICYNESCSVFIKRWAHPCQGQGRALRGYAVASFVRTVIVGSDPTIPLLPNGFAATTIPCAIANRGTKWHYKDIFISWSLSDVQTGQAHALSFSFRAVLSAAFTATILTPGK